MTFDSLRMKANRSQETTEQREQRLKYQRDYEKRKRENETAEQRCDRLTRLRTSMRKHRNGQ
jgi:hypothetical protein